VDLIVGRNASPELLARKREEGFGVIQVPSLRKYVRPVQEVRALLALRRILKGGGYDVVHTHLAKAGVLGRLAARLAGVPRVVHSVYGATFAPTQPWSRRVLFRGLECLAGRVTDAFIFVGRELQEAYCRAGVCPPPKGRVVYYGKDITPFLEVAALSPADRLARRQDLGFAADDLILGNVSRIVPWKGHDQALRLMARLKPRYPNLRLIIVGDAKTPSEQAYKQRLQRRVQQLGLAREVIFTGWVKDPARHFAIFDLYLLTSMPLEGVPGAVIEAAVTGVPVVGYDCYGVREIPGVKATLVPGGDFPALAEALEQELRRLSPGTREAVGPLPWADIRRQFALERMLQETRDIYQDLWRN